MSASDDRSIRSNESRQSIPFPSLNQARASEPFRWQTVDISSEEFAPKIRIGSRQSPTAVGTAKGDVIVLDQDIDAPVEVVVGQDVIATGQIVVSQGKLAVEIKQVLQTSVRKAG